MRISRSQYFEDSARFVLISFLDVSDSLNSFYDDDDYQTLQLYKYCLHCPLPPHVLLPKKCHSDKESADPANRVVKTAREKGPC